MDKIYAVTIKFGEFEVIHTTCHSLEAALREQDRLYFGMPSAQIKVYAIDTNTFVATKFTKGGEEE